MVRRCNKSRTLIPAKRIMNSTNIPKKVPMLYFLYARDNNQGACYAERMENNERKSANY